jgi:peptidoglycan/LPS O-acetylase OafA/YrhL
MTTSIPHSLAHTAHLTHPKYRPDIDGLRAIAILSVVGFHAFPSLLGGGFIGVDVFFVISGYLISTIIFGSLARDSFSFTEFYVRRIKRIFPALLVVLIACFVVGWFTLLAEEYKQLGKHIAGGAGFISNLLLWNESGYFDAAAETKPLLHLWSLGVEEQYYLVWPLILWFAWKQKLNLLRIAIGIGIVSFALSIFEIRNGAQSAAAFYSPQTRFWELMLGSVLAYTILHRQHPVSTFTQSLNRRLGRQVFGSQLSRDIQAALGAALIATGALAITRESLFPGWWALLPTSGALLIISAGAQAWFNRMILSSRVMVWFGLISFPLYLWHWPLLAFARILGADAPSAGMRVTVVIASVLLAWLTYRFIEKPLRFGKFSRAKVIALLCSMVAMGLIGYNCYARDGLGFRLDKLGFRLPPIFHELSWTAQKAKEQGQAVRVDSCLLNSSQDYTKFSDCITESEGKNKPALVLWGDSYAGHLYPGYKAVYGDTFNILQRTISACAPILDMDVRDRPYCKEINDHIIELIQKIKPKKVVLSADWTSYDWKRIEATVTRLKEIGIKNIDIVGCVPQWHDSLYKQLYMKYRADGLQQPPFRMNFGLNQNFIHLDSLLNEYAGQLGVRYISPMKILCNEAGCLTRIGERGETLTAYDAAHLTVLSSIYLVAQFQTDY